MSDTTGTVEGAPPGGLFSGYASPVGSYDEMLTGQGLLRAAWDRFGRGLEAAGQPGLSQRAEQARRLLRENGVTYNISGAPQGPDRPWELDPLPLLMSQREWQTLGDALVQRVTLLNRLVADLYGPQELVRCGLLPPQVLYNHPGFLLPCHGIQVPGDQYLQLYAAHLARQTDGQWVVLADRTQGPSGAGYAVENRVVLSRTLPQEFQSLQVERLASFFLAVRETLRSLAPANRDNPRVVLLSPGPRSASYFEDVYLARYLGYTLVEGGDLTVRGERVFLKTLGGLLSVDVILRRTPDEDADPLELKPESSLGVAGLVHAVRAGRVVVANALGSGLLEAPALLAFLPAICRHWFGEDLKLASVATWWCGQAEAWRFVEAHFAELVIRPAFLHRSLQPVVVRQLSLAERQQWLARIRLRPELYVAQAEVQRSTAPVWSDERLQPWQLGLRVFVTAAADSYRVMPGGLASVSPQADNLGESIATAQRSKDVWVLSDRPVPSVSLLGPPARALELRRSANDLPSRVADNLFWLGRQVERAEGLVRHLRSVVVRLTNELQPAGWAEVQTLVAALADQAGPRPPQSPGAGLELWEALRGAVLSFVFDVAEPAALPLTLQAVRRTASIVRDRLSLDSWRIANQLDLDLLFPFGAERRRMGDVLLLLNQLLNLLSAFSGLATESMTRGAGWRFLDMGRRIERGAYVVRLVRRLLVEPCEDPLPMLEALLEIADSSLTYRYRYLTSLQLAPVLDLVLVDESNPRAVGFQLAALSDHVRNLRPDRTEPLRSAEQELLLAAQARLRLADVEALCVPDSDGRRRHLESYLERVGAYLPQLSDSLTHTYLTHTAPARQLASVAAGKHSGLVSQSDVDLPFGSHHWPERA